MKKPQHLQHMRIAFPARTLFVAVVDANRSTAAVFADSHAAVEVPGAKVKIHGRVEQLDRGEVLGVGIAHELDLKEAVGLRATVDGALSAARFRLHHGYKHRWVDEVPAGGLGDLRSQLEVMRTEYAKGSLG
jgi:hypothetical protein